MTTRPLDPEDLARLRMDTAENPMVITAVVRLDRGLAWDELVELVEQRLLVHERLRARITSGAIHRAPRWGGGPVDPRNHVSRVTLATAPRSDVDLADLVSDLMARPLDLRTSPWHLWLVDGADSSTLVFRVHHVLADGVSLLRLLFAFSDEGASVAMPEPPRPSPRPAGLDRAHAAALARLARLAVRRPDRAPNLSGRLSGRKRVAWTNPIDLESLRRAAHAVEAHVNDVFLAVLAGALRDVLAPDRRESLHALVPVALERDAQHLGNHFVSVFVPLPVCLASPAARVRAARDAMRECRALAGVSLGRALLAGASLAGRRAERLVVRLLSRRASLVATDLAGPPSPLHLGGSLVTDVLFAAPAPGSIALSANAFSYAGQLRVTIASDAAILADPGRLAALVDEHARATVAALS